MDDGGLTRSKRLPVNVGFIPLSKNMYEQNPKKMLVSMLKNWWILLLKGIIFILLSIYIFSHPDIAILGLTVFIGMALLISGVIITISSIFFRKNYPKWKWYLAEGLIDTILGIIILTAPGITATLISFFVGFWFLFYGITVLFTSFQMKRDDIANWQVEMIFGIIAIIFSIIIIFNPFAGAVAIALLMGTFFLLTGVFNVVFAFFLRERKKEISDINEY
jgi:uncharacterized membrane protein HdeD (DUF308 family)